MADPVTLAIDVALIAAEMAITASQKIKGPRLDDLNVTLADYGARIPRFWGKRRLQPQIIWAEKLREKKKTSKTKGGKFQNYKYYGTWAVLIADHEIDTVSRIWMDKHLVYQTVDAGPIAPVLGLIDGPFGLDVKLGFSTNMRIYLGTEDQTADPRMEAWCEDRYGADSCPAYKGSSYIVFEEIPLEKFGNRIPQITVEAINQKTDAYPYETNAELNSLLNSGLSPDGSTLITTDNFGPTGNVQAWDIPTRTLIATNELPTSITGHDFAVTGATTFTAISASRMWQFDIFGGATELDPIFDAVALGGCQLAAGRVWMLPGVSTWHEYSDDTGARILTGFAPTCFFGDTDDNPWAIGPVGTGGDIILRDLSTGIETTINTGSDNECGALDNGRGQFFVYQANANALLIDKATLLVTNTSADATAGEVSWDLRRSFSSVGVGAASIWLSFKEWSTATGELLRSVSSTDWTAAVSAHELYDPVNHAIMSEAAGSIVWRFLDRVASNGVTLKTVVDDVAEWCGLSGQDTTALTQTVLGYSVTQGSGKDMIAPLLDIHDVDARPHDFTVQFKNRGSSPSGTLLTEDFVRGDSRYTVTIQQDTDLPRKLTFNYADEGKDQQANNAIAQRPLDATDATREETIDLSTYVDTPDGAQQKADRFFRRAWNSRERIKLSLTAQSLGLEPGDVTTASLDGALRNVRVDKATIAGQQIDCEFVRDETGFAVLNNASGAEMEGRDPETIYVPAPTKGFVLDIPLIQDADNDINPILYEGAGAMTSGSWPGAGVYRGDDGTYDEAFASIDSASKATWGYLTSELATANPNLWDRGNTVTVNVLSGTLTSTTEAAIDADPTLNLAYLGGELINFTTATLTTGTTYELSGFKRARRGTTVSAHAIGADFVLAANLAPVQVGTDDIGDALSFKVQSIGRNVDAAAAIDLTFTGATVKPYAPAQLKWTTDGTDMFGEIIRRTRVGGSWNGGSTIPLAEISEAYEVDVYHLGVLKRTITVTGTNTFTYTAAQISADSNTVGVSPTANVYQMSDVAGRGFALAA